MSNLPAGLSELDFVETYYSSALRKPSVVADSVLRALVLAGTNERHMLSGLIAEQLAEACRRLAAVYAALADRRFSVARTLAKPLPGVDAWLVVAQDAGTLTPEQLLRHLALDDEALDVAAKLRGIDFLPDLTPYVAAAEAGSLMFLVPPGGVRGPLHGWLAGPATEDGSAAVEVLFDERHAATLADLTADISSIARGFLGVYLGARHTAGRRP